MRFVTPRSSRQGASPATRDLSLRLMLRASRTSPLSQSDLVPWPETAPTADERSGSYGGKTGRDSLSRARPRSPRPGMRDDPLFRPGDPARPIGRGVRNAQRELYLTASHRMVSVRGSFGANTEERSPWLEFLTQI